MNDRTAAYTSPLSLMFSFLVGGAVGAGVALLLAPRSGRATRESLLRNASDAAGSARDLKDKLIRRGERVRDEARRRVDGAVTALAGDESANLPV
jgi:gas vesicle protein